MSNSPVPDRSPWVVFLVFLKLGLTSFGGPVAHLGYFREEFVVKQRWLGDRTYADLVSLCQFLPGPTSSQIGMALGLSRAGYAGAFAAWAGFTLPSAIALILFALGIANYGDVIDHGLLQGLKVVAVAIVAQAVWGMARHLCPDALRITLMMIAACLVLLVPLVWMPVTVIAAGGVAGRLLFTPQAVKVHEALPVMAVTKKAGAIWLGIFAGLLLALPLLVNVFPNQAMAMFDAFYRAGSLVFGGGHVVLPLLQAEVVPSGWVGNDAFLAGYGATQAVPGPLFTFAAFLGAAMNQAPNGWIGGMLSLVAIFLPSFLLIAGALPFWEQLRRNGGMQAALMGINAAVVGLLLAALYDPIWTSAILDSQDFCLALLGFVALVFWKLPPWLVVAGSGLIGWVLGVVL